MAINYSATVLGTVTMVQQRANEEKPRKYKIQIRDGNCLAIFILSYKAANPENPKKPWMHQLMGFLVDEQHLKRVVKSQKENVFANFFNADRIEKVKLNLFYKKSNTLLKYMVKDGLKVECYYKEEPTWSQR